MLYEYEINENLSMKDIDNILQKSKVIRQISSNVLYLTLTSAMLIILFIILAVTKFRWDYGILIFIGFYIIGICMVLFSSRNSDIKRLARRIGSYIGTNHSIEGNENKYMYKCRDFTVELSKEKVRELIIDENYILIVFLPKKFRHLYLLFTIIPKNIFESKEELNRFINTIS
ncbi:hypothetical protein [Clostridium intestinale]|uniref:YcxB-like protein domain-containing protein n=1 Tax=Clostridium intestinale URNW TaxID=1294142 RepID=U2NII5_9CLOT|nr:hypothetical protein [Clostridium intestinale]ERK28953.1 hypothetical protein CINTURNW_3788 [Clostridium intestinale URNW]